MDHHYGNITEERRNELRDVYQRKKEAAAQEMAECKGKMETFINAYQAKELLEKFSKEFGSSIENLTLKGKRSLLKL